MITKQKTWKNQNILLILKSIGTFPLACNTIKKEVLMCTMRDVSSYYEVWYFLGETPPWQPQMNQKRKYIKNLSLQPTRMICHRKISYISTSSAWGRPIFQGTLRDHSAVWGKRTFFLCGISTLLVLRGCFRSRFSYEI